MQSTLQILNSSLPKTIIFQEVLGFSVQNPTSQNIATDSHNESFSDCQWRILHLISKDHLEFI